MAEILQSEAYYTVKEAVVDQLKNEKFEAKRQLLELALATNNVKFVRLLLIRRQKIPEDFRVQYESLLNDKSYHDTGDCFGIISQAASSLFGKKALDRFQ
jgi:aminopeptidase N